MGQFALQDFRLRGRRALAEWAVVSVLTLLLGLGLSFKAVADRPNFLIYDALVQMDRMEIDDQIVIIAIDNRSLAELGRWPWPRDYHAQLLERLAQAPPRAIGYDVLFIEDDADDPALIQALTQAQNVYLPVYIDSPGTEGQPWLIHEATSPILQAASGLGHVNLTTDSDGRVRRLPLYVQTGDKLWPHLALQMARHLLGANSHDHLSLLPNLPGPSGLYPEPITFHSEPGSFRTLSFVDVMRGEVPANFLRDKLVLVGATAAGMGDRYATPLTPQGELMSGVEIQAALLQTLIDDCATHAVGPVWQVALSLMGPLMLLAGFLFLRPFQNMVLGLGLMVLVVALSAALFYWGKLWFAPAASLGGLLFAYPMWSWRRLVTASAYMQSELKTFEEVGLITHLPTIPLQKDLSMIPKGDVVSRQVVALKSTLTSLRAYERFTHEGLRSLPDATLICDNDGTIILANDKARNLFVGRVEPGQTIEALMAYMGQSSWRNILDAQPSLDTEPDDIRTPTGRLLQPACSRLTDTDNRQSGYILRLADMTRIRAAERQRDLVVQLLTHDLRAPQASILTLLEADPERQDPDANRRIAAYARQTLELAEGYVQLARAESQQVRAEVIDLIQVAMDAADTLWPQAMARGVTISTPCATREVLFAGDPGLLRRMMINLMDNALKYGPPGEGIECQITQSQAHDGPKLQILVRDRGPGLTPEATERLFQPFGQGGTEKVGVGLGLAFVRTVAERHGGTVAYQAMTPGAAFVVTLPDPLLMDAAP